MFQRFWYEFLLTENNGANTQENRPLVPVSALQDNINIYRKKTRAAENVITAQRNQPATRAKVVQYSHSWKSTRKIQVGRLRETLYFLVRTFGGEVKAWGIVSFVYGNKESKSSNRTCIIIKLLGSIVTVQPTILLWIDTGIKYY